MLVATGLARLFGAGVQYLGSFSMHPWMADVSLLSAPWLALAFLAGGTQPDPRRDPPGTRLHVSRPGSATGR